MWGFPPAVLLLLYNDHRAPLLGPRTQTTRWLLCHSFVTAACRLRGIAGDDGTAAGRAQAGPVGSAGRQRLEEETGQQRRHRSRPPHRFLQ